MSIVMAIKPCNLVLKVMKEKESCDSSETSTPEEYLTPSGDSVLLSDNSAFSFPDLDIQSINPPQVKPLDNDTKLADEADNVEPVNLDENLNQSKARCNSSSKSTSKVTDNSNMNNNLDKNFKSLEKDMETKPIKLKPEKQNHSPSKSTRETAADSDLANIRKKLEERRHKMEMEKRRQEQQWCRQRQAISKEAYSTLFGGEAQNPNDFQLSSDSKPKALLNGKDNSKPKSSGYYKQDSAIAMERLFANEELIDTQLNSGTLDRNLFKKQKAAREMANIQQAKSSLDRKKTSSFRETSTNKSKNSEHRHSVDPNYGISLDRLNSSLSELQGEIMRLSLQQDHIKNLVTLSDSPSHSISAPHPQRVSNRIPSRNDHATSSGKNEEAAKSSASSSQNFVGDSNVPKSQRNSAFRRYSESRGHSQRIGQAERQESFEREYLADHAYQHDLEEQLLNQQGNIPYAHPAIIPTISPYPFLHPFHPPPYYPYAMNPYFQPYPAQPHYSLRSQPMLRNFDYRARDGQLKRDLSLGGIPDRRPSSRRLETSRRDSFSASRSSYLPSRTAGDPRLARPNSVVSDYFSSPHISSFDPRSSLDHDAIYFQPRLIRNPSYSGASEVQSRRASDAFYASDPADDSSLSRFPCEVEIDQMADDTATEQSEADLEDEPVKSLQQPEFFEVNLEAAKRPKPEIGLQRRSKVAKENPQSEQKPTKPDDIGEDVTIDLENEVTMDGQLKSDDEKTETGSVGFIIEDTNLDPSFSAEVEKKRNKLAELHQKRKEELEAKKNIINQNQQVKREQLRLKEEKAQKKKKEERQRRDLIFQKYLQKKAEMSETNSDDESVKQFITNNNTKSSVNQKSSSKLRPPSHGKKQRPQSQLVITSAAKEAGSDFSDDCSIIITAVKQPQTADAKISSSADAGNYADGKKSAQDRFSRFLSCEGEKMEDASGLKLFVKPNQKSNRSIIINAIKDCCLAGVVNRDLKDKVIEEINRSDAKHFVVLFRDAGLQYRGLYSYNPDKQEVHKIQGVGPKQLLDKNMEKFFKYNSGSKNFSEVTSTKHLSSTIDGVTIPSCLWGKKQPAHATPRKMTT